MVIIIYYLLSFTFSLRHSISTTLFLSSNSSYTAAVHHTLPGLVWFQDEVVLLSVLSNLLNSMVPFTKVCVCVCVCVCVLECAHVRVCA